MGRTGHDWQLPCHNQRNSLSMRTGQHPIVPGRENSMASQRQQELPSERKAPGSGGIVNMFNFSLVIFLGMSESSRSLTQAWWHDELYSRDIFLTLVSRMRLLVMEGRWVLIFCKHFPKTSCVLTGGFYGKGSRKGSCGVACILSLKSHAWCFISSMGGFP